MSYRCATCGGLHEGLPDIGVDQPDHYWGIPEEEREQRICLTADTCEIDAGYFFIRGVLEIPVAGEEHGLGFGVWVSLSEGNFRACQEHPDSSGIGPFFGWLCTRLSCFEQDTELLKTRVHFQGKGLRPKVELEPTGHPVAVAQQESISLDQAWEFVHHYDPG